MRLVRETKDNIFITGKAGTGKTTFLKYLVQNCDKALVVAASTGIAAINAGGVTIHSLLNIPLGPITPDVSMWSKFTKAKREVLQCMDLLIIDEVSMVRPDVMDAVDRRLRWVRGNAFPFGGVQIVMFGDLYQLPPVVKPEEKDVLKDLYDDFFFFNAMVWKNTGFHIIELEKIFRQTDERFIGILNDIRNNQLTSDDLDALSEVKDREVSEDYTDKHIHLCTHRNAASNINRTLLGEPTWSNAAQITDKFPESSMPCDLNLQLRVGARVMCLCNDTRKKCYNGMLGVVVRLAPNNVAVLMDNGEVIDFDAHKWANNQYAMKEGKLVAEEVGSCRQFPLTLAWALTIHKSQGLTFDKVALHVANVFCPGQLYVALSRCRTLDGIVSDAYITKRMIIPENALVDFERTYRADDNWYGTRPHDNKEEVLQPQLLTTNE